jgi:hypothetical protein
VKSKRKIYFIENDCSIIDVVKLYNESTDIIVCFNYLAVYAFNKQGINNILIPGDVIDVEFYDQLHRKTDEFSNSWFVGDDGKDRSIYEGISGGNLVSIMFDRDFLAFVTVVYTQVLQKLLDDYKNIEEVVHDFSSNTNYFKYPSDSCKKFFDKKKLFEEACFQLPIYVKYIKPKYPIPSEQLTNSVGSSLVKKIINKMLIILVNMHVKKSSKPSVYLFFSNLTSGLLRNLNSNKRLVVSDFNLKAIVNYGGLGSFKVDHFSKIDCSSGGVYCDKNKLKRQVREKISHNFFKFNGIDYSYLYVPIIDYLIDNKIPELRIDSRKINRFITKYAIKKFIVNDVMTESAKNIICSAKLNDVETVFVDHGIHGYKYSKSVYYYIEPDLCIGPGSYRNYRLKSKYISLGNPSLDSFTLEKRKKVSQLNKILFLSFGDSYYSRYDRLINQEKYYGIIFNAIKEIHTNSKCTSSYRSHNCNNKYNDYVFNFFEVKDFMTQAETGSFESIVYNYDLVVCSVTTCFYQAIAAGVPVIFVEPELLDNSLNMPFSGKNWDEVIRVSNSEDLVDIIFRNIENPLELNQYLENFYIQHSEKYLGNLDGNSAKRILKEIVDY